MRVHFVKNVWDAKLRVYIVKNSWEADQSVGVVKNSWDGGINVYAVDHPWEADLKIYIDHSLSAGMSYGATGYGGGYSAKKINATLWWLLKIFWVLTFPFTFVGAIGGLIIFLMASFSSSFNKTTVLTSLLGLVCFVILIGLGLYLENVEPRK